MSSTGIVLSQRYLREIDACIYVHILVTISMEAMLSNIKVLGYRWKQTRYMTCSSFGKVSVINSLK
jgi:hypothetical protein